MKVPQKNNILKENKVINSTKNRNKDVSSYSNKMYDLIIIRSCILQR